jgi:long-subunit acyl-CoA synthetase (AMP-forming)
MQLAVGAKFTSLEKPYEIYLEAEQFTVENNLITPTYKLKRNIAKQVF